LLALDGAPDEIGRFDTVAKTSLGNCVTARSPFGSFVRRLGEVVRERERPRTVPVAVGCRGRPLRVFAGLRHWSNRVSLAAAAFHAVAASWIAFSDMALTTDIFQPVAPSGSL